MSTVRTGVTPDESQPQDTAVASSGPAGALRLAAWVAVAAVVITLPLLSGPFVLKVANTAALTALAAMALTVLTGTAGLLSLGQAAFLAIGAFTAAILVRAGDPGLLVNLLAGGLASALIGVVVAAATARTVGIYLAVGTFALQHVVEIVLTDAEVKLTQATGFQMPAPRLAGLDITSERHWWWLLSVSVVLLWAVLRWIVRGHVGRSWILAREQPGVAAALGVSVTGCRLAAFALCAFIAGMVGVLHGYHVGTVQATNYTLHLSIVYLTVIVLGGPGRLTGAVIASIFLTVLPYLLAWGLRSAGFDSITGSNAIENVAIGLILIAVLLHAPRRLIELLRPGTRR